MCVEGEGAGGDGGEGVVQRTVGVLVITSRGNSSKLPSSYDADGQQVAGCRVGLVDVEGRAYVRDQLDVARRDREHYFDLPAQRMHVERVSDHKRARGAHPAIREAHQLFCDFLAGSCQRAKKLCAGGTPLAGRAGRILIYLP